MTSNRPYLLRAFYEWIVDNQLTPHLLIDANHPNTQVPTEHIKDAQIVLNVSPGAVQGLELGNEFISFSARFSGRAQQISFPPEAVLGIYAAENGNGMLFEPAPPTAPQESVADTQSATAKPSGKPSLTVVK
jgi:stringent starvation protein B